MMTLALMFAAAMALSGVAQAKPVGGSADAKCQQLAIQTLGPGFNPAGYTFVGGTVGNDNFTDQAYQGTSPDVFCGFGGDDHLYLLREGDIFLGGLGNDSVDVNQGTFYGGLGNDSIATFNYGTFYGGAGNDIGGDTNEGTFYGEAGNDQVLGANYSTFNGGAGDDFVYFNDGTFNGGGGNDRVNNNGVIGTFNGGAGNDQVLGVNEGTFVQ